MDVDVIVQPIYIYGEGRFSENYEINAMEKVLEKLGEKTETKATILPINFIHFNSIKKDQSISQAYKNIVKKDPLGGQYEWLPFLALDYTNLEIGVEKTPPEQSKVINVIQKHGKMYYNKEKDTYLVDKEKSTDDLSLLFENLSFPIIEKSGQDMRDNIIRWGYEDVMKNAWMCFTPIFGKPCGTCHPCKLKIETNMEFLLAPSSIKRYENRDNKLIYYINGVLKRVSYYIDKVKFQIN